MYLSMDIGLSLRWQSWTYHGPQFVSATIWNGFLLIRMTLAVGGHYELWGLGTQFRIYIFLCVHHDEESKVISVPGTLWHLLECALNMSWPTQVDPTLDLYRLNIRHFLWNILDDRSKGLCIFSTWKPCWSPLTPGSDIISEERKYQNGKF